MDELSLLVWLSRGDKPKLIELMCKYTGCDAKVYRDRELITLLENDLIDISGQYHLRNILYVYFNARRTQKDLIHFNPKRYSETAAEINALGSAICSINPKIFDEEDSNKINELKKKYLEDKSE